MLKFAHPAREPLRSRPGCNGNGGPTLATPAHPDGTFVIFSGNIESAFAFTGPSADEDTARAHGRPLVPNIIMQLQPPSEEAEEAA
jgi:hypothetical protein